MSPPDRRDLAAAAAVAVLAAVAVVAALLDQVEFAVAAVGLAVACLMAVLLRWRRQAADTAQAVQQLAQEIGGWRREVKRRQRRMLFVVQRHRQRDERRHRELLATARQSRQRLYTQLYRRQRDQTQQVEALVQLFADLQPRAPMPSSGHWALNPTELLELRYLLARTRPGLVVELGGGTSSIWIGYALAPHGGRLISLDHDPWYAEQTRAQLRRHQLEQVVKVREAPLTAVAVDGQEYQWYEPSTFDDLDGIDMLLVDGPPGGTGPQARLPALPLLAPRLSPEATVMLDDADRPDEQQVLARWSDLVDGLSLEPAALGHLAVLTYRRPGAGS